MEISKTLKDLYTLRENLDRKSDAPDYHINTSKNTSNSNDPIDDFWTRANEKSKKFNLKIIKSEIGRLMDNGLEIPHRAKIFTLKESEIGKFKMKPETVKFINLNVLCSTLTEKFIYAKEVIFVINEKNSSIYWNKSNYSEIKVVAR